MALLLAAAAALTSGVGALFYRKNIKELKELREVYDETLGAPFSLAEAR
jgi:hypothetical protein